ncbi:MAG: hypothetical protein RPU39_13990 [Candidatus Sedimenticola sp. (ex Thyasira tokunagai)]
MSWLAPEHQAQFIALLGAGAWIALIGFMDDHGHITARWRLLAHEAHRSHAHQYASRKYDAHPPVSLTYGAISLLWLMPIAILVAV